MRVIGEAAGAERAGVVMPATSERPVVVWVGDMGFTQAAFGLGQTAELLGVTRQHLRLQEQEGNLRTVALGRRKLVPADEIARLLGHVGSGNGGRAA